MRFDIITIFPEFFTGPLDYGIVRRAREAGLIQVGVHDLRDFTHNRHRTVDDRPFGGGEGMVLKPEPLFEAVESLLGGSEAPPRTTSVILLSASGELFRQETARRLSKQERVILLCGRYEGVDERVAEHLATEEISVGDFVLSGGELPSAMLVDAVTRLLPGALGNEASAVQESFSADEVFGAQPSAIGNRLRANSKKRDLSAVEVVPPVSRESRFRKEGLPVAGCQSSVTHSGILDYPHYTRPQTFRGWEVPEVLLSGNHEDVRRWRRQQALAKTLRNRPELLVGAALREDERRLLSDWKRQG